MTLDCPTAGFVGSSWRRDQHAQRGSQHCMHCHSMVNARDCTLRPKWQCPLHCHSTSNARAARPHTATRRRAYRNGALRAKWQCRPRGAARSGPSGSANRTGLHAQGRVAVPLTLPLDGERTGCAPSHCHSTSSVPRRRAQGRVAGQPDVVSLPQGGTAAPHCTTPPC